MDEPHSTPPAAPPAPPSSPAPGPWGAAPRQIDYVVDEAPPPSIAAGDLIRRALGVLGDNFFAFFAIAAICYVPGVLWTLYFSAIAVGLADDVIGPRLAAAVPLCGAGLAWLVASFVAEAVMVGRTVEAMAQRQGSLGEVFMLGIRRAPQALAVSLLAVLAPLVVFALALGLLALKVHSALFSVAAVVTGILGGGGVACALYVAVPAVVVERVSIVGALERSWRLTRGNRIVIFAALFVTVLAQSVLGWLVRAAVPVEALRVVVDVLLNLLTSAFGATLGAVTYVRLRETSEQVHASALLDGLALRR